MGHIVEKSPVTFKEPVEFKKAVTFDVSSPYSVDEVTSGGDVDLTLSTGVSKLAKVLIKHVASVVNQIAMYASATGVALRIVAVGTDSNIDVSLEPKGTGLLRTIANFWKVGTTNLLFGVGATNLVAFGVKYVAVAVNYILALPSATGNAVELQATGTDTDIGILLTPKGAGHVTVAKLQLAVTAVAAAGSIISDAGALAEGINVVSAANGTKGVILPVSPAAGGILCLVIGTVAAVLKVWPQSGATINALSASAAMSLASGPIPAIFVSVSATQWYSFPLLPS